MKRESLSELETPAVLVDRDRLLANLDRVQTLAEKRGVRLRPHVKTHKCLEIGRLQLEHGAVGITASKVDEALAFIENGFSSVTVAYPLVDRRKVDRLLAAAGRNRTDVRVTVDSRAGVEALSRSATPRGVTVGVYLEIDVGLGRCGMREDDPELVELVQRIHSSGGLRFLGLLAHAGHAYAANDSAGVAAIAAEECAILKRLRAKLESAGIEVAEVSVGSTPTVLASEGYEGITEIRPGNYVFMDRTPVRLGLASLDDVALTVLATVVSRNKDYLIIDAGSKVLSSDLGAHATAGIAGFGLAFPIDEVIGASTGLNVARVSEEHGFVKRGAADIPIGAKLRIVPNHSCPVANLADELLVTSGDRVVDRWPVAGRGKVR